MLDQQLREAFTLMKEGKKQEAVQVVRDVLKADGKNERAWWMMVHLVDHEDKKRKAAERVLQLNPSHAGALKLLNLAPSVEVDEKKKKRGEYDWSKLEQREREGFKAPDTAVESVAKSYGRRLLRRLALGILLLILSPIFFFIRDNLPASEITGAPPEEVALSQLTAAFNGDMETMRYLTCTSLVDEWETLYQDLQAEADTFGIDSFHFDVSKMQVTIVEQAARRTVVALTGEIAVTAAGERLTMDIEELMLTEGAQTGDNRMALIVQDSHWVVCST